MLGLNALVNYDNSGENNPFYGRTHSKETLKKLRNKEVSEENKYYFKQLFGEKIEIDNQCFYSINDCCEKYGYHKDTIERKIKANDYLFCKKACKFRLLTQKRNRVLQYKDLMCFYSTSQAAETLNMNEATVKKYFHSDKHPDFIINA